MLGWIDLPLKFLTRLRPVLVVSTPKEYLFSKLSELGNPLFDDLFSARHLFFSQEPRVAEDESRILGKALRKKLRGWYYSL